MWRAVVLPKKEELQPVIAPIHETFPLIQQAQQVARRQEQERLDWWANSNEDSYTFKLDMAQINLRMVSSLHGPRSMEGLAPREKVAQTQEKITALRQLDARMRIPTLEAEVDEARKALWDLEHDRDSVRGTMAGIEWRRSRIACMRDSLRKEERRLGDNKAEFEECRRRHQEAMMVAVDEWEAGMEDSKEKAAGVKTSEEPAKKRARVTFAA